MIHKVEVDIDLYAHLGTQGIDFTGFIGEDDSSAFEGTRPWDELIDDVFEWHVIPGHGDVDLLCWDSEHGTNPAKEINEIITALEDAAKRLRERLEASKVLDRVAWVSSDGSSREDYILDALDVV